jgi:fermentation-respiration switch protein FrsA (DUF1100 family)
MRLAVERLGPDLDYLPDGETGERRNWLISMIDGLRGHPDLRLVRDGDWSDYGKTPRFAVRPGRRLHGAALDLGIVAAARSAAPGYRALQAAGQARRRFQVAIPGDIDLAMFTFGPSGPVHHLRPFTEALAMTMHQAYDLLGDDLLFQIEVPAETVLLARAPSRIRPVLARLLARRIAALAQGAPEKVNSSHGMTVLTTATQSSWSTAMTRSVPVRTGCRPVETERGDLVDGVTAAVFADPVVAAGHGIASVIKKFGQHVDGDTGVGVALGALCR